MAARDNHPQILDPDRSQEHGSIADKKRAAHYRPPKERRSEEKGEQARVNVRACFFDGATHPNKAVP